MRLAAAAYYFTAPLSPAGDDRQYYEISVNIYSGKGYRLQEQPTAYRTPLYPLFLAAIHTITGGPSPGKVRIAQALWSVLALELTFQIGCLLAGPLAGTTALALTALDPTQILLPTSLYLESFYSVLLLAVAWALAAWSLDAGKKRLACLGLILAISLLCRPILALAPAGLFLWRGRQLGWSRKIVLEALVFACALALPILPWTARNMMTFHRFIPLETGVAGPILYYASQGLIRAPMYEDEDALMYRMFHTLPHTQWDSFSLELAADNILKHPGRYLTSGLERVWNLWTDSYACYLIYYHPDHSAFMTTGRRWFLIRSACQLIFALAWALALLGTWRHRHFPPVQAAAALALYFNLYALATVFARFNSPLSPLIYILAGVGAAAWLNSSESGGAPRRLADTA